MKRTLAVAWPGRIPTGKRLKRFDTRIRLKRYGTGLRDEQRFQDQCFVAPGRNSRRVARCLELGGSAQSKKIVTGGSLMFSLAIATVGNRRERMDPNPFCILLAGIILAGTALGLAADDQTPFVNESARGIPIAALDDIPPPARSLIRPSAVRSRPTRKANSFQMRSLL